MTHTNNTLGYKKAISHARMVTTIEEYVHDIVVSTKVVNSQAPVDNYEKPKRGKVLKFSSKSAARLRFALRNLPNAKQLATFTYPSGQLVNEERFRNDWRRLREWLQRQNLSGLYVRETDHRGLPHLHIVLQGSLDVEAASNEWFRVVGSNDPNHLQFGVRVQEINGQIRLANYLAKPSQKELPTGWHSLGRIWATYGGAKVKPVRTMTGDALDLAGVVRALGRSGQRSVASAVTPRDGSTRRGGSPQESQTALGG